MAKILAVDDSASMRGMVAFTLRGAGHEVAEAENGQLALDMRAAGSFDLVLADVNMPVMDGIAMVRELRAMDAYKGVPILMLTTESHAERRWKARPPAPPAGWSSRSIRISCWRPSSACSG